MIFSSGDLCASSRPGQNALLCNLPEFDNTAVCVQQHPAGFIGGKATTFQHTGRVMGGGIGTGGADGLPLQRRLAYGRPCKGEQRVDEHDSDSFLLFIGNAAKGGGIIWHRVSPAGAGVAPLGRCFVPVLHSPGTPSSIRRFLRPLSV